MTSPALHPRTHFQHIPASPRWAVVLLHPCASSGKAMAVSGRWLEQPDLAILAPDGLPRFADQERHPLKNPRAWSSLEVPVAERPVDDLAYLQERIAAFQDELGPDVPFFLVGHSNGCAMGFRLLAETPCIEVFRAAALYGAHWAGPKKAFGVPLLYANGDSDLIRPMQAREVRTPWFDMQSISPAQTEAELLRTLELQAADLTETVHPHLTRRKGIRGDRHLELCMLHGQGHHWPAGAPMDSALVPVLGPNNEALNLTQHCLEFFRAAL